MSNNPTTLDTSIARVCEMPNQIQPQPFIDAGMRTLNVMWEDTGRTVGSCWGSNITDLTLQIQSGGTTKAHLLPVVRFSNFEDKTGDIPFDQIFVKLGNQLREDVSQDELQVITLKEYLEDLPKYAGIKVRAGSLYCPEKDSHVLMSAQACFLPVPQEGSVEFNPVMFNYHSAAGNPACLAILVCQEGTSATILDNATDRASWGQNVYHRNGSKKTRLLAKRQNDFRQEQAQALGIKAEEVVVEEDANLVLLIQVPLKQKTVERYRGQQASVRSRGLEAVYGIIMDEICSKGITSSFTSSFSGSAQHFAMRDDVEDAFITKGQNQGDFNLWKHDEIERDTQLPIRVTVQLYKTTSNGVVNDSTALAVVSEILRCYDQAEFVGSLVVGKQFAKKDGKLTVRPTVNEHSNQPTSPPKGCCDNILPPNFANKAATSDSRAC